MFRYLTLFCLGLTYTSLALAQSPTSKPDDMGIDSILVPAKPSAPSSSDSSGAKIVPTTDLPAGVLKDMETISTAYQTRNFNSLMAAALPELTKKFPDGEINAELNKSLAPFKSLEISFGQSSKMISAESFDYVVSPTTFKGTIRGAPVTVEIETTFIFRKAHGDNNWYFMDCSTINVPTVSSVVMKDTIKDLLSLIKISRPIQKVNGTIVEMNQMGAAADTSTTNPTADASSDFPSSFKEEPVTSLPKDLQDELQTLVQAHHDKNFQVIVDLTQPDEIAFEGKDNKGAVNEMTEASKHFTSITISFSEIAHAYISEQRDFVFIPTEIDFTGPNSLTLTTNSLFIKNHSDSKWFYLDCTQMAPGEKLAGYRTKNLSDLPDSFTMPKSFFNKK